MDEGSNYGPSNSERVGPLAELASSSVVASQVHCIPSEQQQIQLLSEYERRLHLLQSVFVSHAHEGQYQPQSQNQSVQNVLVDVNPMNLEKHAISSTSTLQPLQDQTGGSQGPLLAPQESDEPMFIKQQIQHNQHNGPFSMPASEPTIAQRLQLRSAAQPCLPKQPLYIPGNCAKRLNQYMHQQHRISNGSIEFWREVITEFFAPNAKKRWCFSLCKNRPKQTASFAQRMWHCQICKQKPGCGYEVTAEMLPGISKVSYDTGILQELLYVDMPSEYQRVSGEIVVHYDKATVQLVYPNLRIVHDGQLCIVFTPDLKICSWDFCIRNIEQFISGRTLAPQVDKLQFLSWKYNLTAQNASSRSNSRELKRCSDRLIEAACGFPRALNLPSVTDVGYTKKYLRSLEMSEVFSCMGDLIDHSLKTGMGPRMSLATLGGSSSQDGVPNSDRKRKRPPVQLADNNNLEPKSYFHRSNSSGDYNRTKYQDRTYACSSSQIPSNESSAAAAAAATIGQADFTRPFAASAPSSSFSDPESSSSH